MVRGDTCPIRLLTIGFPLMGRFSPNMIKLRAAQPSPTKTERHCEVGSRVVSIFSIAFTAPRPLINLLILITHIDHLRLLFRALPAQLDWYLAPHQEEESAAIIGSLMVHSFRYPSWQRHRVLLSSHPSPHMFFSMQGKLRNRLHCRFGCGSNEPWRGTCLCSQIGVGALHEPTRVARIR